jgi:hypothetical protein
MVRKIGDREEPKLQVQQQKSLAELWTLGPKNLLLGASPDLKRDQIKPSLCFSRANQMLKKMRFDCWR